jgi:Ferredoxin
MKYKPATYSKIALTNTGCMGPCMMGPSVLVYPEGVMYGKLKKTMFLPLSSSTC